MSVLYFICVSRLVRYLYSAKVDSRSDLVFPKSSLLEFVYGMIRGSLNSKDARYE